MSAILLASNITSILAQTRLKPTNHGKKRERAAGSCTPPVLTFSPKSALKAGYLP
jgi:hypothetical protein